MHLEFNLITSNMSGETRHAQEVMRSLGITYQLSTPQSLYDSWWFWNCQNVPIALPPYLRELRINPKKAVGHGLSEAQAVAISKYAKRARSKPKAE